MSRSPSRGHRRPLEARNTLALAVLVALVGGGSFGCSSRKEREGPHPPPSAATAEASAAPLPSRAEVVARADSLAVEAERRGGPDGAGLFVQAAEARERIWRVDGVAADALEAIELYRRASRVDFRGACDADVQLGLLEGELKADPSAEYRALFATRVRHPGEACVPRIDAVLSTLSAFEPTPEALTDLGRQLGVKLPKESPRAAVSTGGGVVVQPRISPGLGTEPAQITAVEHYGGKDAARVVVHLTLPTLFSVGELAPDRTHGPRIFVDIEHAVPRAHRAIDGEGLVERVRMAEKGAATRIVLDLAAPVSRRVFYLPEPFRLVIDVSKEPLSTGGVESGPRHVRRVVLDPGHGGHDPGALGQAGLREKDVVLDIAHRAAPLLARELGVATLLTRDADVFVPLDERVARANAFSSDLFVSIHCNASESAASRGVMTFVLDASRDDLAARVAARENAASAEASAEVANVMSHVDRASLWSSNHLAELLQRASVASLSPHYADVLDQGVKSAGFYVLAGARMPAVLFETSFISNAAEERRLDTADYRQKMADAVVNAVRAFRDGL